MNQRSIYFRLIRWYGGITILVSSAFGAYMYYGASKSLYEDMDKVLLRRARNIALLPYHRTRQEVAAEVGAIYSPEANGWFIRISKRNGAVYYVSGFPKDGRFDPLTVPPVGEGPVRLIRLDRGGALRMVHITSSVDGEPYTVEMGAPTDSIEGVLKGLIRMLLVGVPGITVAISLGGYMLVRRSLRPVEAIRSTAEQITFGNLRNRVPVTSSGDELEHLSVTLNQMLGRLEEAYNQASRFSADAAHELRTPLSILLGELESIIQEPEVGNELKERLGSIYEETETLARIAESLFALSRLDAGEAQMKFSRLDLAGLARQTAEQMSLLAEEKKITLRVEASASVHVNGDPARLKQIIVNLLDNAIKYTPEKGNVKLEVYQSDGKAVIAVTDNGVGVPADSLPHVFERFFRADNIRTKEYDGAGLGLSIVRAICNAHGGTAVMTSIEGSGTKCTVELQSVK